MCLASVQKYSWFLHIDFISYNLAFLCEGSLGISLYKDHSFTPSFPSWILFISLSSPIAPARTSSTMLKKSNESDLLASFLILEVKTYCLWQYEVTVVFLYSSFVDTLYQVTEVHFYSHFFSESHSVMSNSLWPHGLYSPWNSPGHNTRVGSLSPL